ncbi:MAG: FAD-dependent oxidoreductase [Candidatus Thermoplasmatota archaeon]
MDQNTNIVIIGCGAGGGTAAQFARKTDRKAHITVIEQGAYPQYSKCGLPYVISGEIPSFNHLIEFSEEWFQKERIELLLKTQVQKIDIHTRTVETKNCGKKNNIYYDKLIIATGAQPTIPPIQGIYHDNRLAKNVFVLRTIDHGKQILQALYNARKAIIVGAGLIGLELADTLVKKGLQVTVVEALPTILATNLDEDLSNLVLQHITQKITVYTNHMVTTVKQENDVSIEVVLKNRITNEEQKLNTDILIIATGCRPETSLAQQIGCKIGKTGGIIVNERSETNVSDVYAVGDCTEYRDFVTREPICIGLGSIVVRQAIAAGINAAGGNYQLPKGVLLTRTSTFFDIEIAGVGPIHDALKNKTVISGKFTGSSRPEYFPGGKPITLKILVDDRTGVIVSSQAVGENAAQRINVFASAILRETTVEEFRKLETAYAPPIAPTLDVITLVCDVVSLKRNRKKLTA